MVQAEDLIPPNDALKIDALSEDFNNDDEEMHGELTGNELMIVQRDDLLGDELYEMQLNKGESPVGTKLFVERRQESEQLLQKILVVVE
ncbi:unnamed protein product [Eruca vesicaria subsp. sativa]|uniref:Uncharacterized protein n=1 Tax=Eruca vesicaria subsp. sativa TaxID=29727 RepID=A0ABC8J0L2_ERUVS|nr:unnamed protein product [Eruca vesicaria subsp. sativa]